MQEKKQNTTKWVQVDLGRPVSIRKIEIVGCHDDFAGIGAGFGFPVRYRIDVCNDPKFDSGAVTVVDRTKADMKNPGIAPQATLVAKPHPKARFVRVTATKLAPRSNDYIFALAELSVFEDNGKNLAAGKAVTARDSIEAPVRWRKTNLVDGIFVGADSLAGKTAIARLLKRRRKLLQSNVTPATRSALDRVNREVSAVRTRIAKLPKREFVYAATGRFTRRGNFSPPPNGKPRPIFLLNRGSVKSPGKPVGPGTVGVIAGLPTRFASDDPDNEGQRRLALANWIVDRRNGLTWRSIVNRIWQYHFGQGIVDSPNDFGRMGVKPTHPELLDWLAADFRDGSQSLKALHRMIVTSSVYRQRSVTDPVRSKIDSGNRFFWRGNRRRLESEALRDSVLFVTGTLRQSMYGPGYDLFGFKDDHSPHYNYDQLDVDNAKTLRRTVYRFIVRSVPDPFMECLDCADPSLNVPKRNSTITALQALSLLNNRFMVRQAEHFADRIKKRGGATDTRIAYAYRLALGRRPSAREMRLLKPYVARHGLTNLCRLLFNTNEFLFVD